MKVLLFLLVLFLVGVFSDFTKTEIYNQWTEFKFNHKKAYNPLEEYKRFKIFSENLNKIQQHNELYEKKQVSFKMGLNKFADLNTKEFIQIFTTYMKQKKVKNFKDIISDSEIPDTVDWREKGAVTDVENQGMCGSSWIYSLTGVLEGQNFLKTGNLISLSNQELADCATDGECTGGSIEDGYKYVIEHGLLSAADYPNMNDGECHRDSIPSTVNETDYVIIKGNEDNLKEAVATIGPIAAAVDASNWQFYSGGILGCQVTPSLNHEILVVGYGSDDSWPDDFWLVKNSWGTEWGENGYVRVTRYGTGNCGISLFPSYPIL